MTEDNKETKTENQNDQNIAISNVIETKEEQKNDFKNETGENETNKQQTNKEIKCISISSFGGIKSIKILKKSEPSKTDDGEVLIRVHSAGLSFYDVLCRQGSLSGLPKTPFTLGFECAGTIEAVGENVDLKVGDRVAALTDTKAWSELLLINAKYVYKLPDNIDFDNAIALTLNYSLAYYLLFEVGNLRPNQSVFVHSVNGGVGQAIVQLASTVKDVTIIGTASKDKHEQLTNVQHLFDYGDDYVTEVKKIHPNGVNLVLDCLYGDEMNKGYNLLKPLGHYILYGAENVNCGLIGVAKFWWQNEKIKPLKLFEENKTISGFNLKQFLYYQKGDCHVRETINKIYKLYSDGIIKPTIDSKFSFEDVNEAIQKLHERKNLGKILLDPSLPPKAKCNEEETFSKKNRFSSRGSKDKKDDKKEEKKEDKKEEKKDDKKEETTNKPENVNKEEPEAKVEK